MTNIQVSILCTAYNHGKYIRDCLEGFVMQQGVTFEVIIHDDASTDDTAEIIREYAEKYPKIFKPIIQAENQFSQGIPFTRKNMLPLATGKYIALCEGDDYWIDPFKLKKQFDALEEHENCYMCLHRVDVMDKDKHSLGYSYPTCQIDIQEMTSIDFFQTYLKATYFQTSSYFILAERYREYIENKPKFAQLSPVGDEAMLLYFPSIGNIYYIDEIMSIYRNETIGSWSYKNSHGDPNSLAIRKRIRFGKMIDVLCEFCLYSDGRYNTFIVNRINRFREKYYYSIIEEYNLIGDSEILKLLRKKFRQKDLKELGFSEKAILRHYIQVYFPRILKRYDTRKSNRKR